MALAEFGFRVCCKRKCFFPFRFISLQADTLFLRFKELKLDLELAEAQRSPWKRPLDALLAARAEERRVEAEAAPAGWPRCFPAPSSWSLGGGVLGFTAPVTWSCHSGVSVAVSVPFGRYFSSPWSRRRGNSCLLGTDCASRAGLLVISPNLVISLTLRPAGDFCGMARVPAGEQGG